MAGHEAYPCPACGFLVFEEPPGSYEICPICFWEDDLVQLIWTDYAGGANDPSLIEAQRTFESIGAVEERLLPFVRKPTATDERDQSWRRFDATRDPLRARVDNDDLGDEAEDPTVYYYWRNVASDSQNDG